MAKTAWIFPGQGAQIAGMGKDFYEQFACSREVFDLASQATGLDMPQLCFSDDPRLNQTEYTQAALLTTELAMMAAVKERSQKADVTAGQSLGEYAALVAAGYLDAYDAISLVRKRGILMQNAVPLGQGAMVAIVGLTADQVEALCRDVDGVVEISNFNSQKQTVVSGEREAVMRVKQMAEQAHARLAVELSVSIPSHSPLMRGAAQELARTLEGITVRQGSAPVVANATAQFVTEAALVKPLLVRQMYSPVRWEQSIRAMQAAGVELFVELGPGETLTKLNKKIDKTLVSINISTVEDLGKLK